MRSIVLAVALAAPVCAVAATPNYTHPLNSAHSSRPAEILLTFVNSTLQDRELVIGGKTFLVKHDKPLQLYVAVGAPVRVYSQTNSRVNGQELMQVAAGDASRIIALK